MHKRTSFLLLLLLSLLFLLASCNGGEDMDNSPDAYVPDGISGNSAFDTSGMPQFNIQPGVYYDAIAIELSTDNPAYTIRYTTDCTTPTTQSPVYDGAFPMQYNAETARQDVTVFNIRAASFDQTGKMIGRVVCGSYLFPKDESRFTTQIISIVTDPDHLYDDITGIFKNYEGKGRAWERPVNLSLYSVDGDLSAQQDLGIRINGTGSRKNAQKNFRLFARKDYTAETGHFNYALFPGLLSEYTGAQIDEFDTFLVRGGASNFHNSMITNLIAYEMMEGSAVDAGNFEPAALYLNGEYYGLMMLMEDYSPYYFESHYGVDENKVTTINYTVVNNVGVAWEADDCTDAEFKEWSAARHFVEDNDMADSANYARACEIFDMDNLIESIVFNCYVNNWDWPRNNIRVWRYHGVETSPSLSGLEGTGGYNPEAQIGFDGRWRYVIKDLDVSMGMNVDADQNYFAETDVDFFHVLYKDGRVSSLMTMFRSLIQNKTFEREFFLYLAEFMSTRGSVDNFLEIINSLSLQVSPEMQYHTAEYNDTLDMWDYYLQSMRSFAQLRPAIVWDSIKNNIYEIPYTTELTKITFKIEGQGQVSFNGGLFDNGDLAYGIKKLDIPIEGVPAPGYVFKSIKAEGGTVSEGNLYMRNETVTITIVFEKGDTTVEEEPVQRPDHIVLNEIGHSSMEKVNGHDWIELYNPTDKEINLKGYSITNGMETYTLPQIKIPAKGFKIIFCSGTEEGGVYAPFTIAAGDNVALYNAKGKLLDQVTILTKASTAHLGRYPDGESWVELSRFELTPNEANAYRAAHEHRFDPVTQNTLMIDGVLFDHNLFTASEDGTLTISRKNLEKAADSLTEKSKSTLLSALDSLKGDAIKVTDLMKALESKGKETYYCDSLNTYIARISTTVLKPQPKR